MSQLQVEKVVAVCFLEAAKVAIEHVGAYRLELSQQGHERGRSAAELTRIYGAVRRLRDYLQRCVSACQEQVPLDLAPEDSALLVACCRRAVEDIDVRLQGGTGHEELLWLQRKRQVLIDKAVELASNPLVELGLKPMCATTSEALRSLHTRLLQKLRTDGRAATNPSSNLIVSRSTGMAGILDRSMLTGVDLGMEVARNAAPAVLAPLFDAQRLSDPRLRGMAVVELRTYERLLAVPDYRLAMVVLAGLLEAAVLDHAMVRRDELGLTGTPDTWNLLEVLVKLMGEAATPQGRNVAYHLFSARNMLRPVHQMLTPTVVTAVYFDRVQAFAQRALHLLGVDTAVATPPSSAPLAVAAAPESSAAAAVAQEQPTEAAGSPAIGAPPAEPPLAVGPESPDSLGSPG